MKSRRNDLQRILLIVVLFLAVSGPCFPGGPGFDCKKAKTPIEQLICKSEDLSSLDGELSERYRKLMLRLRGNDEKKVKQSQKEWLKTRNDGGNLWKLPGRDQETVEYLKDVYSDRLEEIRAWQQYVDRNKTTAGAPWKTKCWERTDWVPWTTLSGDGVHRDPVTFESSNPVCMAFEKLLNTTCEPPAKLRCDWTLSPGEERFSKVKWEPLEWKDYWDMIVDMHRDSTLTDSGEYLWKQNETRVRSAFETGSMTLSLGTIDIDNDHNPEQVVRLDLVPCQDNPGTMFAVMDPKTRRHDRRYERLTRGSAADYDAAEILLYKGKAYKFGADATLNRAIVYEGRYLPVAIRDKRYSDPICHINYVKGGKKQ